MHKIHPIYPTVHDVKGKLEKPKRKIKKSNNQIKNIFL